MHEPTILDRCLMWSHTSKLVKVLFECGSDMTQQCACAKYVIYGAYY